MYSNWIVPALIDSEPFDLTEATDTEMVFTKEATLTNASGTSFRIGIRRRITLLCGEEIEDALGARLPDGIRAVAYRTENTLANLGSFPWTKETGMPSVWLLGMYPPTPSTVVFIPYHQEFEGKIVNDAYFGKVPADRLVVRDGLVCFRIDGKYRSKIGLPEGSAKGLCGSVDPVAGVLNILKYTVPEGVKDYLNSQWGPQEDHFGGDVVNSYNDGPTETGEIMGPFYEIETSSPGAALEPGGSLTHTQGTFHLEGSLESLAPVARTALGADLEAVAGIFRK